MTPKRTPYTIARAAIYNYKVELNKGSEFKGWTEYKIYFVYRTLDKNFPTTNSSFRGFDNVLGDLVDIYTIAKTKFNVTLNWVPWIYKMWYRKCLTFFNHRIDKVVTVESKNRYKEQIQNYKDIFGKLAKETFGIEL